jgi:hypothetical protein
MLAYRYNPFTKPISDFPAEELNVLRDVTEGWFVDYKSQAISPKKFGKHLSAFANQFGGWLFVGVIEDPTSLKAGSFPGIPTAEVGGVLVRIREAVNSLSPAVYFDHRIIDGPVAAIGLAPGQSIIVVGIPEGANPPYIHSSGSIYQRVADSSEPKALTDRAILDAMWRKSKTLRNRLREFILTPIKESNTDITCCHVFLMEDTTLSTPEYDLDRLGFHEAVSVEVQGAMSIPLDNLYSTQDGYIGRHYMSDNDPLTELVSLRWWRNGNVKFTIPINQITISSSAPINDPLLNTFVEMMGRHRDQYHWILNLDQWLLAFLTLTVRFVDIRTKLNSKAPIYGKIVFSNAKSRIPFVGMESYLSVVKRHGIPVSQDSVAMFPPGDPNDFTLLPDYQSLERDERATRLIVPLIMGGLLSLGVTFDVDMTNLEPFGQEFAAAVSRVAGKSALPL